MWHKLTGAFALMLLVFASQPAFAEQRAEIGCGKGVIAKRAEENYFCFASYRPEWLQKDWKFHYGTFFRKEDGRVVNIIGVDQYLNAYVPLKKLFPNRSDVLELPVPFIQVGWGLSVFDKLTENLGSNGELHLFFKIGAIKGDQYWAFAADHWSNGGITPNNNGENFISVVWGIVAF